MKIPVQKLSLKYIRIFTLTHLPIVPHICVCESGQHWFRQWLVAYLAPSQHLNQCGVITNCTLRKKRKWNFNQSTELFIHENASVNSVWEMPTIFLGGDMLIILFKINCIVRSRHTWQRGHYHISTIWKELSTSSLYYRGHYLKKKYGTHW